MEGILLVYVRIDDRSATVELHRVRSDAKKIFLKAADSQT